MNVEKINPIHCKQIIQYNSHKNKRMNNEKKVVKYYRKNVYGKELIYISDDTNVVIKNSILRLTGQKTIDLNIISNLENLGIVFEEVLVK